jgi:hypothetical protein
VSPRQGRSTETLPVPPGGILGLIRRCTRLFRG